MKDWDCISCENGMTKVRDDFEYEFCCSGSMQSMCGCMGMPINPIFCNDCEQKLIKSNNKKTKGE